jgi:DNA primase
MKGQVTIESREFALSNLDKVLWPEDGYTKGELINYYVQAAPYLLPHLIERPLVLTRFPDGIQSKSFYQKNAPTYLPAWIRTFSWYSRDSQQKSIYHPLVQGISAYYTVLGASVFVFKPIPMFFAAYIGG